MFSHIFLHDKIIKRCFLYSSFSVSGLRGSTCLIFPYSSLKCSTRLRRSSPFRHSSRRCALRATTSFWCRRLIRSSRSSRRRTPRRRQQLDSASAPSSSTASPHTAQHRQHRSHGNTRSFIHSSIHSFIHSFICSLSLSLTYLFTCFLIHSLDHLLMCILMHSYSCRNTYIKSDCCLFRVWSFGRY